MDAHEIEGEPTPAGGGNRPPWNALPQDLRHQIETLLGSPVAEATSQPGGFSPGSADRVVTATGQRCFVKATSSHLNEDSAAIHRAEARALGVLPTNLPIARLLGAVESGTWIALVLSDVEGRHPALPWTPAELTTTLDTLHSLASTPLPADAADSLPQLPDAVHHLFQGWHRLTPDADLPLPPDLAEWCRARLPELRALAEESQHVLQGHHLVHQDVRADNLLITEDGTVTIIDWPWAAVGAGWFDALTLLINVRLYDPTFDADAILATHPVFAGVPNTAMDAVLAGMAGFFVEAATQPPPPGLPTLRSFQRDHGDVTLAWLRDRLATNPQ